VPADGEKGAETVQNSKKKEQKVKKSP